MVVSPFFQGRMVEALALGGVMSLGGHVRWNIIFVLWRTTWQALYKGELWFPSILSLSQLIVTTPGLDQLCWPPLFCTRNSPCSAVLYQERPMLSSIFMHINILLPSAQPHALPHLTASVKSCLFSSIIPTHTDLCLIVPPDSAWKLH